MDTAPFQARSRSNNTPNRKICSAEPPPRCQPIPSTLKSPANPTVDNSNNRRSVGKKTADPHKQLVHSVQGLKQICDERLGGFTLKSHHQEWRWNKLFSILKKVNERNLYCLTHTHTHTAVIVYMHAYSCTAGHPGAWICFKHTARLYSRGHVCLKSDRKLKLNKNMHIYNRYLFTSPLCFIPTLTSRPDKIHKSFFVCFCIW